MAGTITRGKVIRADLAQWDGKTSTYSRLDATGGTVTGLALGNEVDVLQVFGSGTTRTRAAIASATAHINTSDVTLVFAPGTWTIDANLTIASNFTCHVPAGCVFSVSNGVTLTFSGDVHVEDPEGWYTGAGTVVVSREGSHGGVWHRIAAERSAGITPVNHAYPPRELGPRYNLVADGSTDNTTAILTLCNAMGGIFKLPYNVLVDHQTLIEGLDTDVLIINESYINDLTSAGERTKTWGIISSDEPVNDSSLILSSGHHPNLLFNNYGTEPTGTAAASRVMSIVWASGQIQNEGVTKRGSRGGAAMQFLGVPASSLWVWKIQKFAPWLALDGAYETWVAGEVIPASPVVYRRNSGGHYVSASAGTTAAAGPTHTSGTVADGGGVDWTFLSSSDTQIISVDEYGRVLVGDGTGSSTFEQKVRSEDPGVGHYTMVLRARKANTNASIRLYPVDGAAAQVDAPYLQASSGTGLGVVRADGANYMMTFDDTQGVRVENHTFSVMESTTAPAVGDNGTIATAALGTSRVAPAAAVTGVILAAGTVPGQTVTVINEATGVNTVTFAAYATSNVADGTTVVITGARSMSFVWDSSTSAWYAQSTA